MTKTIERLRELFEWDDERGVLRWRIKPSRPIPAGSIAGSIDKDGYRRIGVDGGRISAHRIVWALAHGHFPSQTIDHINGDRDDNRLSNLRDVSRAEQSKNTKLHPGNKLGVHGIRQRSSRFEVSIGINGKKKSIGSYAEYETAVMARKAAERAFGFHSNHGRPTN